MPPSDREVTTTFAHGRAVGALVRAVTVRIRSGPQLGQEARVDRPVFVVGSGADADLILADRSVSRRHFVLSPTADGVLLRDEGSKNGTWLGGARLGTALVTSDVTLVAGDSRVDLAFERSQLQLDTSPEASFGDALGASAAMRHVFAVLRRAAASEITILLEGETGVGKEVLADAVHRTSSRRDGPFVAVDCGAIPAGLVESELFGHERGAFTGAVSRRQGVFEAADGGTLFLDEIGELPLDLQPKLLRALERREVRAVGASAARRVDVRIVAATNRSLADASSKGEFRSDLYYRLAVARVRIPPLRDRPEDIALLANSFHRKSTGDPTAELPVDFVALLASHSWPGNVRELRNAVDRFAMLDARTPEDVLGGPASSSAIFAGPYHDARRAALDRFDRAYAAALLAQAGGVVARAAELAQMGRASFYRLLERARLDERSDG